MSRAFRAKPNSGMVIYGGIGREYLGRGSINSWVFFGEELEQNLEFWNLCVYLIYFCIYSFSRHLFN